MASSRQVVHIRENSGTAGKGSLAASHQETCVPRLSKTSASSTQEGKVHGGELPYSHPANLLVRVGPIPIA